MNTRKRIRPNRRRGFTLLEILLVVGLLALLASFAIPALVGQGEQAKKKMVQAAIGPNGTMMQAIELYKFNCGQFPENLKDLVEKPSNDAVAKKWTGPYLKDISMLKDPWGNDYYYNRAGNKVPGSVDLWSAGPDGQDGTDDDIVNWKTDK
ncbi:MAG TPA: type II secretion system major pseudopilin GspG [Phycisphaerae bacterium]|nr:type II secretion system major pseudopilin GspG [Phycisphaerae bacterium]